MRRAGDLDKEPKRMSVRRRRVNDSRREELLAQLEDILLAEGFTGLTMDDLAEHANCSKTTLYALADTKEQLVIMVAKRFFGRATEEIEAAVDSESDARLRIATYLNGVGVAMRRQSPAFYADMVGFRSTAEIYRRNSDTAARRVRDMIEEGVRQGVFRPTDGTLAAQLLTLAIDGVQSGMLLRTTGLSAGDAITEIGDLLLNGLNSRGPIPVGKSDSK
ncbi:TetR/AcrR family transcriptional regulator [Frankia sp. EAN1pec]|uniref:TetR family transcriptional regulator n=1 Tax=Parafrankia sp. (strain EAN1pec) TaxID=298653 RepID=UPI0012FB15F5